MTDQMQGYWRRSTSSLDALLPDLQMSQQSAVAPAQHLQLRLSNLYAAANGQPFFKPASGPAAS